MSRPRNWAAFGFLPLAALCWVLISAAAIVIIRSFQ